MPEGRKIEVSESGENRIEAKKPQHSRKLTSNIVRLIILVTLVGIGIIGWHSLKDQSSLIPKNIQQSVNFPLYYPASLPQGYSVDKSSFSIQDKVLIFYINSSTGKRIGVSEEALPANLPNRVKNNAPLQIPGEKDFTTGIGQAHIGLSGDKYISDIITPKTWIILNVSGYTPAQARQITQSFSAVD